MVNILLVERVTKVGINNNIIQYFRFPSLNIVTLFYVIAHSLFIYYKHV